MFPLRSKGRSGRVEWTAGRITLVTADIERGLFNRSARCNLLPEALLKEYGSGRLIFV